MEVEDNCQKQENQCNSSSGVDVDSGIENMEVEDSDKKEAVSRSRVRFDIGVVILKIKYNIKKY